ncbi:uncharacterized protein F4822DRAFT_428341 [Hypoxylon trugodes]|uniref:uncharacterized protein n=1 Tax=Hypoxylon trugodes TaxID=326681 RepID=UPI0021942227|nr:uncharacterized protein F4822DRAFT_428341 [Hypoxylon trugodes]KAI1389994.1 hypothetical protein F4822DRAFT_428341 [Hypoxylon trugodes]
MKSFVQALLFTTATCATLQPRQSNSGCCFQLTSVGTVNETVLEDHVGDLTLGGSFQQGGFCLDKTSKTIQDGLKHYCFMRAPDYQFECYQGALGTTAFNVASPQPDGKMYLNYNNGSGTFYACPIGFGSEKTYDIYSTEKPDKAGCVSVALALTGETPECSAGNTTLTTRSTTVQPTRSLRRDSSLQACSISPSAPSLAPSGIRPGNSSDPNGVNETSAEVIISPDSSPIFDFTVPDDMARSAFSDSSLCALQFRMPVCNSLPEGYPCYSFSGLEQEVVSNSGMTFSLVSGVGEASWNNTELHQIFPGDNTTIGTFECGKITGGDRKLSWQVNSVRDFSLIFLQAGIGEDAQFQDGIGAWVVPCQ